jgi:hypothetical protein
MATSSTNSSGSTQRRRTSNGRLEVIEQLTAEWRVTGRSGSAVRSLHAVARHDEALALLVFGSGSGDEAGARGSGSGLGSGSGSGSGSVWVAPVCPTPCDLIDHLRRATGRTERDEAARLVSVLLRESGSDPFLTRLLVQALLPGIITLAGKLRWGRGGEWCDGEEFFGELLTMTWMVLLEWAGQDRRYAVLDLLSAIRCRMRRQLFRAKELGDKAYPQSHADGKSRCLNTDLDELTRVLIQRHSEGMCPEEIQVLYAHNVLGYSIAELAAVTGRDRRVLYAQRDRGRRNVRA